DTERPLDDDHATIAEHLTSLGYRTAGFAANTNYCNAWFGLDRGFAHYEDAVENDAITPMEVLRSCGLGVRLVRCLSRIDVIKTAGDFARKPTGADVIARVGAWLDEQEDTRPTFLFVNLFDAHGPYVVPKGFARRFLTPQKEAEFLKVVKRMRKVAGR